MTVMNSGQSQAAAVAAAARAVIARGIAVAAVDASAANAADLPAAERCVVEMAVPQRVAEFAAGRSAARRALRSIGESADAIGRGPRGEPLWPRGVVGSISHGGGTAIAAVGHVDDDLASIGVDLECVGAVEPPLWPMLFTVTEQRRFRNRPKDATIAFAAKEAIFKALYPTTGLELDFLDAEVDVDTDGRACTAVCGLRLHLRWALTASLALACVTVDADQVSAIGRGGWERGRRS